MTAENVLIVGAGGYLGAHLSLSLTEQGYDVTALCFHQIDKKTEWHNKIHRVIYGDVKSEETVNRINKFDYDYVVYLVSLDHFASEGAVGHVNNTNVLPLWKFANVLQNKVKKFIYFSTQQVYGNQQAKDENVILTPSNTYGLTHQLCEDIINLFDRKSDTGFINVRLSNGYGEPVFSNNNCWWLVVNDLCKSAFEQNCIRLQSDGSPQRDFIHVNDIARAIDTILKKQHTDNTYNLASGITYTIGELACTVKEVYQQLYGKDLPILVPEGKELQITTPEKQSINIQRLKGLGFKPKTDLKAGITHIFKYLEQSGSPV